MYRWSLLTNSLLALDSHHNNTRQERDGCFLTDAAAPPVRAVGAALPQVAAGRCEGRVDLSIISTPESMYLIIALL